MGGPQWSGCSMPACVAHRARAGPSECPRDCIIPAMIKDFACSSSSTAALTGHNGRGTANEAIAVDSPMRPGSAYREQLSR